MGSASSAVYAFGCFFSPSVNDSASGGCLRRRKQHKLAFARYPDILHGKTCVLRSNLPLHSTSKQITLYIIVEKNTTQNSKIQKLFTFFLGNQAFFRRKRRIFLSFLMQNRKKEAYSGGFMKKKLWQLPIFFVIGGILYPIIEILYRGYTHISMSILGGICLSSIRVVDLALGKGRILLKALFSSIIITQLEFICGVIVNLGMGLSVWDYSDRPFNIAGQICPLFTFFWFLLSLIPLCILSFSPPFFRERKEAKKAFD